MYGRLVHAVLLTVDSAKLSGAVLSEPSFDARGALRRFDSEVFGQVKTQSEREHWVKEARGLAKILKLPLVVVGENHTSHGLSRAAYASLQQSWGLWLAAFESCGADPKLVVRVDPQTWRAAVFGRGRPKTRDALKAYAVNYAHRALGAPPGLSDDIAEAMCLRVWAERASEVHELLTAPAKKKRKKAA
jgi:hypothetical protein